MNHVVTPEGERIPLVQSGPVGAPAWVVAHGVGSSPDFVEEAFADAVRAAGGRLVTYDLRGHGGRSPAPTAVEHALDRHVADLHAVATSVDARVVGGVSLGGHVAVAYAARGGPCRAVVAAIPAWTGRAVPGSGPHAVVAGRIAEHGVARELDTIRRDRGMAPWLRDVLLRDWPAHDPSSLAAALRALDGGLAPTEAEIRSLPVPLGLAGWRDDPAHPLTVARDWAAWAPAAALEVVRIDDLEADRAVLGRAAVAAVRRAAAIRPV